MWLHDSIVAERRERGLQFRLPVSVLISSLKDRGAPLG
jgi:hypothetical protein